MFKSMLRFMWKTHAVICKVLAILYVTYWKVKDVLRNRIW
jgi:hypothetical protein